METEWIVEFFDEFRDEFRQLPPHVKVEVGAVFDLLRRFGPTLGRPQVDTLKGSTFANMKEIRADTDDDWYRFAFAFDPQRRAIVLCGGGKGGRNSKQFYRQLVATADRRYAAYLEDISDGPNNKP
jgi:hypothetical protein